MVLNFGPINSANCFPFEELNRKVMSNIKGQNLIGEELIKLLNLVHLIPGYGSRATDECLKKFITKYGIIKTSNSKKSNDCFYVPDDVVSISNNYITNLINNEFNLFPRLIYTVPFVIYNGIKYTNNYNKKRFKIDE